MSRRAVILSITLALLSGCATQRPQIVIAPPAPAPIPVRVAAMPAGAYPGMAIPARLADGGYATPNRGLGEDGTVWHLRAALNVAALACRGVQGDQIVAGYNAMLGRERAPLAAAQTRYAAEFRVAGVGAYDEAMTRLYNFFSQSQVRDDFCAASARVLTESTTVAPVDMPGFARTALPQLEAPFLDFYRAYDAWRAGEPAPAPVPQSVIAVAAAPAVASVQPAPKLHIDPSVFAE